MRPPANEELFFRQRDRINLAVQYAKVNFWAAKHAAQVFHEFSNVEPAHFMEFESAFLERLSQIKDAPNNHTEYIKFLESMDFLIVAYWSEAAANAVKISNEIIEVYSPRRKGELQKLEKEACTSLPSTSELERHLEELRSKLHELSGSREGSLEGIKDWPNHDTEFSGVFSRIRVELEKIQRAQDAIETAENERQTEKNRKAKKSAVELVKQILKTIIIGNPAE